MICFIMGSFSFCVQMLWVCLRDRVPHNREHTGQGSGASGLVVSSSHGRNHCRVDTCIRDKISEENHSTWMRTQEFLLANTRFLFLESRLYIHTVLRLSPIWTLSRQRFSYSLYHAYSLHHSLPHALELWMVSHTSLQKSVCFSCFSMQCKRILSKTSFSVQLPHWDVHIRKQKRGPKVIFCVLLFYNPSSNP